MTLPAGVVTFVLGDVEGSTRLWEQYSESMAEVTPMLDALVNDLVVTHSGVRPEEQGEGDSFVAAFALPSDAAAFALAFQRALNATQWSEGLRIEVRMAIHTGEAKLGEGGSYMGEALNRCARIRALAAGGQVLVSAATSELVVNELPADAFLKNLGAHRLRDLARPEQIDQLCHPELRNAFPPLRSIGALPNNLPLQLTSFVGREREIQQVVKLLLSGRVVTLTGPGGCGKTRLAVEVAAGLLEEYPDGVWLADLAPVTDARVVTDVVAAVADVRERPFESMDETLAQELETRKTLLIVDNCEHVIDSVARLAETLLRRCPHVTVLATSREPLSIDGEVTVAVPTLPLPDEDVDPELGCESIRLFIDRAEAVRPGFDGHAALSAIGEICRRVDGIPLAIELAAARTRMLSPAQIAERLTDRFALLSGGRRSALPRQQRLEASLDWSYDLLSDSERTLLRRLGTFAGGWTLAAAEAVCADDTLDSWRVLDVLSELVDKSLVIAYDGPTSRYRMLETIRFYAHQRLVESGEAAAVRAAHLEWVVDLAAANAVRLEGPEVLAAYADLEAELGNIRAAISWALEVGNADAGLRLAAALAPLALQRHQREGAGWLQALTALPDGDEIARATAQLGLLNIAIFSGDLEAQAQLAPPIIAVARAHDHRRLLGRVLNVCGWAELVSGEESRAICLADALDCARAAGDDLTVVDSGVGLGVLALLSGKTDVALLQTAESVERARALGHPWTLAVALAYRGLTLLTGGDLDGARAAVEEANQQAVGDDFLTGFADVIDGYAESLGGRLEQGVEKLDTALTWFRHRQSVLGLMIGLLHRAAAEWRYWLADGVIPSLDEAASFAALVNFSHAIALCDTLAAERAVHSGDVDSAAAHADAAVARATQGTARWVLAPCLLTAALVAEIKDEHAAAEDLIHQALAFGVEAQEPWAILNSLERLGSIAIGADGTSEGVRLLASADATRQQRGLPRFPVDVPRYERAIASARDQLGTGFTTAWQEGSAVTLEDAVAYAQRGRGRRRRRASGWSSLTPTELEVSRLVAQGLRNADIAERLFISVPTVKTHLTHIYTKLGITSRVQLAQEAGRRPKP